MTKGTNYYFPVGNKKLGRDICVFNFSSSTDCPSAGLGLCQHSEICYSKRCERFRPTVRAYHLKQQAWWGSITAKEFAEAVIKTKEAPNRKVPIKYLRFSESGDFRHQGDVDKFMQACSYLKGQVKVYGYSARRDLDFSELKKVAVVNGQGFMVSNKIIVPKKARANAKYVCVGDCRLCSYCKVGDGKIINIEEH